jgi:hypothetical protein
VFLDVTCLVHKINLLEGLAKRALIMSGFPSVEYRVLSVE